MSYHPSKGFLLLVVPLICLTLLGISYLFVTLPYKVAGISMQPTFQDEQNILGIKFFPRLKRGDIVIYSPTHSDSYIARVIGLPGEKIEMANYYVKINDQQITEPYLAPGTLTLFSKTVGGIFQLKDDEYFVMTDNRPYGDDSRFFGPIKRSDIKAKVIF
jgi:signal peptidase I